MVWIGMDCPSWDDAFVSSWSWSCLVFKDSIANYAPIWTVFSPAVKRTGCALQHSKRFIVPSVCGASRFANLRRKFSKTQNVGRRLVPNTSAIYMKWCAQTFITIFGLYSIFWPHLFTIEIVINSTRVMGICVTISFCYCIAFEVMVLFLVERNSYSDVAGWVAGWLSHSGIVSKPLNLSENFFDHLKAPSL